MTTISRRFYNEGYQMTGEGRRVDILDPKKEKKVEIFFYEKGILILTKERYIRINLCMLGNRFLFPYFKKWEMKRYE